MKELSIEEKAKAYDEALAKAVKIHRNYKGRVRAVDVVIEEVFPELKESEDEKIRKVLLNDFKNNCSEYYCEGVNRDMIIAWLERQGEQKPVIEMKTPEESLGIDSDTYNKIVDECVYSEQKPTDNVEPKFHEGEWITNGDYIWQIVEIKPLDYILQSQDGNIVDDTISHVDEQFHSFTVEDAKAGDVIYLPNGNNEYYLFIFKGIENAAVMSFAHFYQYDNGTSEVEGAIDNLASVNDVFQPATKEQRDLLFQKMKEAGYEWDAEKKELKKIEQESTWNEKVKGLNEIETYILSLVPDRPLDAIKVDAKNIRYIINKKQTPTWSEEDEIMKNQLVAFILSGIDVSKAPHGCVAWLKSLKDRVQLQPMQEWSEKDETMITNIIIMLKEGASLHFNKKDMLKGADWLKSLRLQNRWKPSDEQMKALKEAVDEHFDIDGGALWHLYEDLKKLKD